MSEKKGKFYLSLPITGRELKDVKVYAKRIKKVWEAKGYEVVTPFEVVETRGFDGIKVGQMVYAYCMGKCVEALMMCDGIIMCKDWFYSKGCRLEYNVAEIYGLKVMVDETKYMGRGMICREGLNGK